MRRGAEAGAAVLRTPAEARALVDGADAFIFDCDGVLWTGPAPIDGAAAAVGALQRAGKRTLFVTNNSAHSREGAHAMPWIPIARRTQRARARHRGRAYHPPQACCVSSFGSASPSRWR